MSYRYRGYLIDLDGTLFRGREVIEGGLAFVSGLEKRGIQTLYLTNNASRTPEQVAEKLRDFGYPAAPEQVVTSAQATAHWIGEQFGRPSVYAIGEEGLRKALHEAGCTFEEQNPDVVVMGIDRAFSYDKMKTACLAIHAGARFIGTNGDRALPTEEGLLPGNGSLIAGVAAATGIRPTFIGKPERPIMDFALKRLGMKPEETLVVGDNLMTDILAGVNVGIDTLLVFSGVTTPMEYRQSKVKATYTVSDLREWDYI
ncbi:TIGR01457 family HAD-type hydrolase [Desmospora profundinema]|uniref:Acid sugar phosphatase n=1 Tax=Desmospora profundinema TaxID=1571184 RepID=A0ABU1IN90_9BACL|nr:TIGR01457 family HAD-type hydrolase [Desmospora profundinema]MDR6226242.1 4-nitrophenyl phosphatase [Desmospora profundinema]